MPLIMAIKFGRLVVASNIARVVRRQVVFIIVNFKHFPFEVAFSIETHMGGDLRRIELALNGSADGASSCLSRTLVRLVAKVSTTEALRPLDINGRELSFSLLKTTWVSYL